MEPIPSVATFRMADRGLVRTRGQQTGGWISAELPKPPGYDLARRLARTKYIRRRKQKK